MLYQKKNNILEPLTGSTLYAETPIGTVIASFLAIAPSGYIKADDTVYTKAQYPELYERIPDVFKDTVNETFTIDLREVALKGIGLSSLTSDHYSSTGLTLGEFIEDRNKNHRHQLTRTVYQYGYTSTDGFNHTGSGNFTYSNTGGQDNQVSYEGGATNEVKSVGVNYFIKAKHVALPIDIIDAISEEYATKEYVDAKISFEVTASSGITISYQNNYYKNGMVFINFDVSGTTASPSTSICTVPSEYAPGENHFIPATVCPNSQVNSTQLFFGRVNPTGSVTIITNSNISFPYKVTATYVIGE